MVQDGALWLYTSGKVRQVFDHRIRLERFQLLQTRVIETDMPINRGDSGSGVANERGELVGLNCCMDVRNRSVSYAIELSAVKAILDNAATRLKVSLDPTPRAAILTPMQVGSASAIHLQAVETLGAMGVESAPHLAGLLEAKFPKEVRIKACEELGTLRDMLPPNALHLLLVAAETDKELRPAVAAVLVNVGSDKVGASLRARLEWSKGPGVKRKSKYDVPFQIWVIQTLPTLPLKDFSEKERLAVVQALKQESIFDPDEECRAAASTALRKIDPDLLKSKPVKE